MDWLGNVLVSAIAGGLAGGVVSYFVGLKQDAKIRERDAEADLQLLLGVLPKDAEMNQGGLQPVPYSVLLSATKWTVAKLDSSLAALLADGRIRHTASKGYYAMTPKAKSRFRVRRG